MFDDSHPRSDTPWKSCISTYRGLPVSDATGRNPSIVCPVSIKILRAGWVVFLNTACRVYQTRALDFRVVAIMPLYTLEIPRKEVGKLCSSSAHDTSRSLDPLKLLRMPSLTQRGYVLNMGCPKSQYSLLAGLNTNPCRHRVLTVSFALRLYPSRTWNTGAHRQHCLPELQPGWTLSLLTGVPDACSILIWKNHYIWRAVRTGTSRNFTL